MSDENDKIKAIIQIREENEELKKRIQFLEMENFEHKLQYNRMKNQVEIVKKAAQGIPKKLNEIVKNISSILSDDYDSTLINDDLQESTETTMEPLNTLEPGPSQVNLRRRCPNSKECSKTQLVSPHRVNGHILSHHFNPTVKLPRMSQNIEGSEDTE